MAAKKRRSKYSLPEELAPGPRRRPQRVADLIQAEVASLLIAGVKDPRVAGATLMGVRVTDDLRTARVLYTCGASAKDEVAAGLDSAKGFIRSHLAKQLQMRYVPDLIFVYDASLDKQQEINDVLREIGEEK
ncbi:MAG: 30S ribosome-binding factor RbfA [Thermodesulfobacteriota bacterium]